MSVTEDRLEELEEYTRSLEETLADQESTGLRVPILAYIYKVRPQIPNWWGWRYKVIYLQITLSWMTAPIHRKPLASAGAER